MNAFRLVAARPPKSLGYSRGSAMNTTLNHTTLNSLQFHVLARESFCLSFVSENVCGGYTQIGVFGVGYGHSFTFGTKFECQGHHHDSTPVCGRLRKLLWVKVPRTRQMRRNLVLVERPNALLLLLYNLDSFPALLRNRLWVRASVSSVSKTES